jgi:hypothetical protein
VRVKMKGNPMQKPLAMHLSPRCGARTRSRSLCLSGAMPNGRCRMHGGKSPGAPKGTANGNYCHGLFTREPVDQRRGLNAWIRATQRWAEEVD